MIDEKSKEEQLNDIGKCAYGALADMVSALGCDYERLQELRDQEKFSDDEMDEREELETAAGDCADEDDARQRIMEDPLSVQVRSGWCDPGAISQAEEFEILLTTGGPAVRIRGELNEYGAPCRACLEVQDWFTPWTQFFEADQDVLLAYCQQFYFGE